jgi:catechol 2,3-dioxygenase-like lactoylglutathione lyase family enzyme
MELNHTIIWAADREKSAAFYADIFGLEAEELFGGHFLAVRINDSLTFDFAESSRKPAPQHYAFKVTEQEFDEIFERLEARDVPYWSRPRMAVPDMKIYRHNGGRGVYFHDVDKNGLEILTASYDDTKPFE